jgi:hypothetical protein
MNHDSQASRVLAYMVNHGSITVIEAERHLNCHRLAARISDLRAAGVPIESHIVNREGKHWAEYRLGKPLQLTAFG